MRASFRLRRPVPCDPAGTEIVLEIHSAWGYPHDDGCALPLAWTRENVLEGLYRLVTLSGVESLERAAGSGYIEGLGGASLRVFQEIDAEGATLEGVGRGKALPAEACCGVLAFAPEMRRGVLDIPLDRRGLRLFGGYLLAVLGAVRGRVDDEGLLLENQSLGGRRTCPTCGHAVGAQVQLGGEGAKHLQPSPHSVALCGHCGGAAVFTEELQLRPCTADEDAEISARPEIQAARRHLADWHEAKARSAAARRIPS